METNDVIDNREAQQFEIHVDGETAFLAYQRSDSALTLVHIEVPERLRGQHLAERLVVVALDSARAAGLRIIPVCPFVRAYLRKHPQP